MKRIGVAVALVLGVLLVTGGRAEAAEPARGEPGVSGTVVWREHNPVEWATAYPGELGECWMLLLVGDTPGGWCVPEAAWRAHPIGSDYTGPYIRLARV